MDHFLCLPAVYPQLFSFRDFELSSSIEKQDGSVHVTVLLSPSHASSPTCSFVFISAKRFFFTQVSRLTPARPQ